jgi:glucarate dehydratase
MHAQHGFRSWKVKGGVRGIADEIADVRVLADAFAGHAVRLDPNARWSPEASLVAAEQVDSVLEYLEDPCEGTAGMAWLRQRSPVPLATNMLNESYAGHLDLIRDRAADVVLLDHHIVGGLARAKDLADRCQAVGMATSMHSNSHLGISLAAMTHLAAAVTGDVRTNDTHYPWNRDDDVIAGGPLPVVGGEVAVPTGPGLGVRLDPERLAEAHERYLATDIRERDDARYARRRVPSFERNRGTWTFDAHPGAVGA